jgi:hypothetical protein
MFLTSLQKKQPCSFNFFPRPGQVFFTRRVKIHGLYNVNLRFENTTLLYEDMCCLKRKNCPLVKSDNKNGHKKTNHPSPTTYRVCTDQRHPIIHNHTPDRTRQQMAQPQPPTRWFIGLLIIVVWIGYAATTTDYKKEGDAYLKQIGRSDLIVQSASEKTKQSESVEKQMEYIRTDMDAILAKLNMRSVAPGAS